MRVEKQNHRPSLSYCMEVIGEELVSWKRSLESWITSQTPVIKLCISIVTLSTITYCGLAVARVDLAADVASSFEVYTSLHKALLQQKRLIGTDLPAPPILVASADLAPLDNYIQEIFTPVPNQQTAAEMAIKHHLKPPLPGKAVDNGPPPLPNGEKIAIATNTKTTMASRHLLWPMRGGAVSSRFGMRWGRLHQGTDISAPYGTPILAAADGKVIFSGWEGGYGQLIILDHGNGVKTKYGHCSVRLAAVGETVRQGEIIGKVGATGHATGPHLHYEVIREGHATNPERFTRRR